MRALLGDLIRVSCSDAEVVLTGGVHLRFRLDPLKQPLVRNLVETQRFRRWGKPREAVLVDAYLLQLIRRAVATSIAAHRVKMHLPAPRKMPSREFQLRLL